MTLCVEHNSEWQWLFVEDRSWKSEDFQNKNSYGQVSERTFADVVEKDLLITCNA